MPRLSDNPDFDVSASVSDNKFVVEIEELFASKPPGVEEFFADSIVRMRIGMLIAQAMDRPTKSARRDKSR